MIFAPHILQRKVVAKPVYDEFGRVKQGMTGDIWETVCRCRCDDNNTVEFKSDNGEVFRPQYHVVCDGSKYIRSGEYVRCLKGDEVRGEGEVVRPRQCNYLNYMEVYLK